MDGYIALGLLNTRLGYTVLMCLSPNQSPYHLTAKDFPIFIFELTK
jgi:hypothetical protein